ncbi:MAG TPA: hypothetical protein VGK43_01620 [Solirubrobacterales bacterium]
MKLESLKDFYLEQTQLLDAVPRIAGVAVSDHFAETRVSTETFSS